MNLKRNLLPLLILSVLMVTACEQAQKQEQPADKKLSGIVDQVEKDASSLKTSMDQEMKKGSGIMKEASDEVKATKDSMMSKLQELIEKAKKLLAEGNFEEAMSTAQSALALDSNSQEAKDIITQAKEKIQAMAGEKLEGLKGGMGDKLKSFGQ